MYLNVYVPLLQTAAGAAHFFRGMRGAAWPSMVFTTGGGEDGVSDMLAHPSW